MIPGSSAHCVISSAGFASGRVSTVKITLPKEVQPVVVFSILKKISSPSATVNNTDWSIGAALFCASIAVS